MTWNVGVAAVRDIEGVRELYERVGYGGGVRPGDRVCVARDTSRRIVAAARLCNEQGTLVLRGVFVDEAYRGKGLGSDLLEIVDREIGRENCWCVPYSHLVAFYSRIGFRVAPGNDCPAFLADRAARYEAAGSAVVVMRRRKADVA